MNKKSILLIITVLLIVILIGGIFFINNKNNMKKDSYKFKLEYEKLNNTENNYGKKNRKVNIDSNNPIKYVTAKELVEKIDNGETFVVYFGFSECPWCRSMIENLFIAAENKNIDTIYYLDVKDIRNTKKIENGKIVTVKEGSKYYNKLLEQLDSVLNDYLLEDENGNEISTNEKRIYAPNVVAVVNGVAEEMTDGVSSKLKDPYSKIDDKMNKESIKKIECIFKCLENENVCVSKKSC